MNREERRKKTTKAAERDKLNAILKDYPAIKKIVDGMLTQEDTSTYQAVANAIEPKLKEQRDIGILIGWQACCLRLVENIKSMQSVDEVIAYCKGEANKIKDKLKLKYGTIEDVEDEGTEE